MANDRRQIKESARQRTRNNVEGGVPAFLREQQLASSAYPGDAFAEVALDRPDVTRCHLKVGAWSSRFRVGVKDEHFVVRPDRDELAIGRQGGYRRAARP